MDNSGPLLGLLQALTQAEGLNPPLLAAPVWVMLQMIAILILVSGFSSHQCNRIGSSTRGTVGGGGPSAAEREREDLMNDFMRLKESSIVGQEAPTSTNDKVSYLADRWPGVLWREKSGEIDMPLSKWKKVI